MSSFHNKFDHLRFPLINIQTATNNFADENIIRRGVYGNIYKGQLLSSGNSIHIAARRMHSPVGQGTNEFLTEIMMLSSLKHQNMVSIIGFCDENDEKIIINKFEANGSLDQHLNNPITLTWTQRLHICLATARALTYIRSDEGHTFRWEAKLSGFGLSIMKPATRRHAIVLGDVRATQGYMDPTYTTLGGVTHKSDVYSFGVVLFEVLTGRKADFREHDGVLFAELVRSHYEKETLKHIIHPDLLRQMDLKSLKKFSETAYWCLNEQRTQRPDVDRIIFPLTQALELQLKHENLVENLQRLKIGLDAIVLATENFDDKYCIGSGGYGKVYKSKLEHFDSSAMEDEKQLGLPRRSSIVAIKSIFERQDIQGEQGFNAEISTLSSCNHPNIVYLIGFRNEPSNMILVYEYVSNGSLDDYFSKEKMTNLTWVQRINICIDIARGLDYLHTATTYYKQKIIHCDIKSANILLDENWRAKIADFGLSRFHPFNHMKSTIITDKVAGTKVYLDPEYERIGKLKKESDVYSFGVVLFEILTGRLAYDSVYIKVNEKGLAPMVQQHFTKGTLNELVDPVLKEERDEKTYTVSKGPNQDSLDIFYRIGYQCLAEMQFQRPTMKVVVNELEKALHFQETHKDNLRISYEDIRSATQDFDVENEIGKTEFGILYKGKDLRTKEPTLIVKNQSDVCLGLGEKEFLTKLAILFDYKHQNIIDLVGYCIENNERISVFEYPSNGSLDAHLNNASLTWKDRLKIGIDVAMGLEFLHGGGLTQAYVIHRDIKSSNILLNSDWKAKITVFGLSMITIKDNEIDFVAHDIYSLGVILFEMMCGRKTFLDGQQGLVHLAKRHNEEGKIDELVFADIKDKIVPKSLTTFQKIAYQCLHVDKKERPTAREVVFRLKEALEFHEPLKDGLQISLQDIIWATQNFNTTNIIGMNLTGSVYKGEISSANGPTPIAVKRWYTYGGHRHGEFKIGFGTLSEYKHENVIGLVGYCNENKERISVLEYASNGSLARHLKDASLTWMQRLKIGIDVALGLDFLHGGGSTHAPVIHRDIKSSNILLNGDWKAKIRGLNLSTIASVSNKFDLVFDFACGTLGYCDPQYKIKGFLTRESDIYSVGVVLFEMMSGRMAYAPKDKPRFHVDLVKRDYEDGKVEELVFEGIKDKIVPKSLIAFLDIAYQCLSYEREKRPAASKVALHLKGALKFQEDYEIWGAKLPVDYKEIIQMSKTPEIYSNVSNNDLYEVFSKGILLQEDKVCFSLSSNDERNELVSAMLFSYEGHRLYKWRSIRKSRFQRVVKILDISNLKIQIKIKTQILSPNVIYGAHLVFKFYEPRKISSKLTYVNLKYHMGSETLHAYFAKCGDDEWMMIELCRFIPHKKDVDFEVLLESLSQYYCGSGAIYVEGIHFRAINDATLKMKPEVSVVYEEITQLEDGEKLFSLNNVNENNCHMLPAKMVLYESSNVKCFNWKSLAEPESSFLEVAELLSHQVFGIKCNIETQKLSPNTGYECYLIFKLSQKCHGLQCPVKVRDVLLRKNKEPRVLYFKTPRVVNFHSNLRVPYHREDGLMEVVVWEFNSGNSLSDDYLPMNLKLICYEGTMSGLIVYGIQFRPI